MWHNYIKSFIWYGPYLRFIQYIKTLSSVSVWNVTHDKCLFQNVELKGNVLTCFDELEKVLHSQNDLWYLWSKFLKPKLKFFKNESIASFFWKSIQFSLKNCESARLGSSLFWMTHSTNQILGNAWPL